MFQEFDTIECKFALFKLVEVPSIKNEQYRNHILIIVFAWYILVSQEPQPSFRKELCFHLYQNT